MRTVVAASCAVALCACVGAQQSPQAQWMQASEDIHREAQAGTLTPLQEQEQLRDAFVRVYGPDPKAMDFYAYSIGLMQRVQNGTLSLEEARELTNAKEQQVRTAMERQREFEGCAWSACSGP